MKLVSFALAVTTGLLAAQQTKTVPAGMEFVEGPLVYTYPFGRADAAIQILYDGDQLTMHPAGFISGMKFRPSQVTAAQTALGYTKNYRVTFYIVPTPAAAMVADPAANIGSAVGVVVFHGPVTLPAIGVAAVAPQDFTIDLPFALPFVFNGSMGNLLILLETSDLVAPPATSYRIDAVTLPNNASTGIVAAIDTFGCVVNGNSLAITGNATSAIVAGTLTHSIAPSSVGAFPAAIACLSLQRQTVDLTAIGMTGCTMYLNPTAVQLAFEGTGYGSVTWNIPNLPVCEGMAVYLQVLGFAASGQFADSAVSNALAVRIGSLGPATQKAMVAFRGATGGSWAIGRAGEFVPVVQFQGFLP